MFLKNKVILVTGSTAGIGAGIARQCLLEGARVMLHGRNEKKAHEFIEEWGRDTVDYYMGDLADVDISICKNLINATVEKFGSIDGLVNNAGSSKRSDIDSLTAEAFDRLVQLNLRAPLFLTQSAVHMFRRQKKGGVIVNIGSINAYGGQSDLLIYAITKGGLMTMTRNLGNALAPEGIRVNQINVGWTVTENECKIKESEGFSSEWATKVPPLFAPSGNLLTPAHVAHHAVFWLSDLSAPVNGAVYELEQYPVLGRNLINEMSVGIFR